ncbi:MAG: SDR family oxidoreductase [Mucilaginibacter polytrichastri]|nr:SDR family oxidoreductase [Mucilaginibacter polytrichastri]
MKNVLITGANKSIGFETARQLAQKGYFVYLGSRDLQNGQEAARKLKDEGFANVRPIKIDVSDALSIAAAREEIGSQTETLDVLINNAGISGGLPQEAQTFPVEKIRTVFETNFFGAIAVTQAFFDLLQNSTQPRIVNVTSGLASLTLHSDPSWRFYAVKSAAYGPSKTALNAYTVALAYQLQDTTFKVNAVDPGYTKTDFNDHHGTNDIPTAAGYVVDCAILDEDGPSGKFFSYDNNPESGISPW